MRLTAQRLTVLLEHGLHESEAKVYLALVEQPRMSAGALAKLTGVPRSHLYKVLQDLHEYGLVDIFAETSSRGYRARPFSEFLARRESDLKAKLKDIERQGETLGDILRPPPEADSFNEAGDVKVLLGRRAVAREVDALLSGAQSDVVLATSSGGADRVARLLAPHFPIWGSQGQHVSVTVILPEGARASLDWADLPGGGSATLRKACAAQRVMTVVVDRSQMLVVHCIPDTPDPMAGRDFALCTNDKAIVESHHGLLMSSSMAVSTGKAESARKS